jgi:enamine deaminase RidA (YjgF/YER057c/UK114 family)
VSKQAIGGQFTGSGGAKLPFSRAMRAGDLVFVSGQMATDGGGRIIEGGVEAGCTLSDVVKCTCWIDDARDFARFNATYAEFFPTDPPARSTTVCQLVLDGKLEIEAIAYKPL